MTTPLLAAAGLLARAGGGHSFGGGGGSRGGGGGGSSFSTGGGGGGHGFFFFPFFLGGGGGGGAIVGLLMLVILVVVAVVLFRLVRTWMSGGGMARRVFDTGSTGASYGAGTVPAAPPRSSSPYDDSRPIGVPEGLRGAMLPGSSPVAMASDGTHDGLATITAHDPAFDETAFLGEAERAFFVVQQAWTELKPDLSRRVMADGIWQ
ncbi:MAG TPA: hypothetical protein VGP96_03015, partial [Candidatus Dormibacteraeota bacterium]|nr:hypothetical protein [Candidatus Dormibacteraeota bacterium]